MEVYTEHLTYITQTKTLREQILPLVNGRVRSSCFQPRQNYSNYSLTLKLLTSPFAVWTGLK